MRNTGRMLYVPAAVINQLHEIGKVKKRKAKKEAWQDLLFYTNVGRNVDDFYSGIFGGKR